KRTWNESCSLRGPMPFTSTAAGSPRPLKICCPASRLLLTLPFRRSERCSVCPLLPTKVPFGRWQPVQVGSSDSGSVVSTSLLLNEAQLAWLKTLKASNRNSTLMFSYFGIPIVLCNEASNRRNALPLPALRSKPPFASWKSTGSPNASTGPNWQVAPEDVTWTVGEHWLAPGIWNVFGTSALQIAAGFPAPRQSLTAVSLKFALLPSNDPMPATEIVPSGSTFGRCWVSLPAPKNLLPLPNDELPVEIGYGRPD